MNMGPKSYEISFKMELFFSAFTSGIAPLSLSFLENPMLKDNIEKFSDYIHILFSI